MRILVTDGMDKGAIEKVRAMGHELVEQFYEPDELGKALRDFDVAIIRSKTKLRAKQIDEAKGSRFKCVIRAGVGLDNIDVQYAKDNGIEVKNTPKSPSESVAELAMAHMFSCARYISIAGHSMREGKWEKKAYGKGIELTGKTLGIVGFGRIGQKLGKMAKAIGMNHWQTMLHVILPQALRNIMPQIGNNLIINIKDSCVLSVIGLAELLYKTKAAAGALYMNFETYTITMIMYFIMTFTCSRILRRLENKMDGPDNYDLATTDTLAYTSGMMRFPDEKKEES